MTMFCTCLDVFICIQSNTRLIYISKELTNDNICKRYELVLLLTIAIIICLLYVALQRYHDDGYEGIISDINEMIKRHKLYQDERKIHYETYCTSPHGLINEGDAAQRQEESDIIVKKVYKLIKIPRSMQHKNFLDVRIELNIYFVILFNDDINIKFKVCAITSEDTSCIVLYIFKIRTEMQI
jgi:hypothetical protein